MLGYNEIIIPVADANLATVRSPEAVTSKKTEARGENPVRQFAHGGLIVWALVHCTAFCFVPELGVALKVLTVARYLLWPTILLAVLLRFARSGGGTLVRCLGPVLPYFLIGTGTGLLGFDPVESARLLVFWLLAMLAAAVGGMEMDGRLFRRVLVMTFAGMIVASIIFVLLKPDLGLSLDNRAAGGNAWRGLFPGKNSLGLIAVYAVMLPIVVSEFSLVTRLVVGGSAMITLVFANSQGAVLAAVAMVGYVLLIWALRRVNVSNTARSLLLSAAIISIALLVIFGLPVLLDLLHRDATLTGRSSVWPQWLARATTQWLTGFGPGSFTEPSFVTIDLSASDVGLGNINTPHNMLIAIFGEVGIFGLIAFILPMAYFILVLPFARSSKAGVLVGTIGLVMLVGGISETREVFGLGMNMFLVIAAYANYRHSAAQDGRAKEDGPERSSAERPVSPFRDMPVLSA